MAENDDNANDDGDSGVGERRRNKSHGNNRRRRSGSKRERNNNLNAAADGNEGSVFEHHHQRQTSQISTDTSFSSLSTASNSSNSEPGGGRTKFRTPADQLVSELFETIKAKKSSSPSSSSSLTSPKSLQPQQSSSSPPPMDEVFTLSSFQHQKSHEDLVNAADGTAGSISSLRKIWEAGGGDDKVLLLARKPSIPSKPVKNKSSASNIYAAPSELYGASGQMGCKNKVQNGSSAVDQNEVVYADLDGVLGQAKDLQDALRSAGSNTVKHDKVSLMRLADRVERFRNVCTHYADNVCATGRFRFRAQLNRLGQMAKELVFLATRSPQHGPKPIVQEIELITEDLVVLMKK